MQYSLNELKSGLKIITVPIRGTKTATILVMVATGSKYERREESGISHFLEHLFFKGTKKRPTALAISSELDAIGADFNAFTSKEYTGYYIKADAGKLELGFDVVSDMLLNSKFAPAEIEREKGVIIEELNMYQDNPMYYIEDLFETCLYGDTPAGRDVIGTKDTISGTDRKGIVSYLKAQYGARNTVVIAAGNVEEAKVLRLADKYFSNYHESPWREKTAVKEAQTAPADLIHYKKTDQAHLALGVRTFPYGHKDDPALKVMSLILGGSMSSRLFISLRERRGLAYYVRTDQEAYTDHGYLCARAGVPVAKAAEAVKIILDEFEKLVKIPVSAKELQRVKDMLKGRLSISLESSDSVAQWFARKAVMEISRRQPFSKVKTPDQAVKEIMKVSQADVKHLSGRIFTPENLNLAVIGPYKNKTELKKLISGWR